MKMIRWTLIFGLLVWGISFVPVAEAQPRGRPEPFLINPDDIDREEGAEVLRQFRSARLAGDFCFVFALEHRPREGDRIERAGRLWGTWNEEGPLSRLWLAGLEGEQPLHLLFQNGMEPWLLARDEATSAEALPVEGEALLKPLREELIFSPFELLMPFVYWDDWVYEGSDRVKGRPAYHFLFYPPVDFPNPELGAVRVTLDARFNALLRAQLLSPAGEPLKTLQINRLKRINEQWIVREIDLLDERSRDKTRFRVEAAAVGVALPGEIFAAEALVDRPDIPAREDFEILR